MDNEEIIGFRVTIPRDDKTGIEYLLPYHPTCFLSHFYELVFTHKQITVKQVTKEGRQNYYGLQCIVCDKDL